jgi:OOP family OmpA-OmpF porin
MKTTISIIALVGLLTSSVAAFGEFYAGASVGQSDAKDVCDDRGELNGFGITGSCDDTDTAWKLFGGYQFTQRGEGFATGGVEFGYVDAGEFNAEGTAQVTGAPAAPFNAKAEAWALYLALTATVPLADKFGLFGKVGAVYWDMESTVTGTGPGGLATFDNDDDGTSFAVGLGAQFKITDRFGLRAEWERAFDIGEKDTVGETDVDLFTAGAVVFF